MINPWNPYNSFRGKLIFYFILVIVVPTLVIFLTYSYNSQRVLEEKIYNANQELVDQSANTMNELAARMVKAALFAESDFNQFYRSDFSDWNINYDAFIPLKQLQNRLTITRDLLLNSEAFLQVTDGRRFAVSTLFNYDNDAIIEEDWYSHAQQAKGFPYWSISYKMNPDHGYTQVGIETPYVLMSRILRKDDGNLNGKEVVAIGVPSEAFFGKSAMLDGSMPRFLIQTSDNVARDTEGNSYHVIFEEELSVKSRLSAFSKRAVINGNRYLINTAEVSQVGFTLLQLMPYDHFTNQLAQSRNHSLVGILLVFLMGTILFLALMIRLTKPIYSLLHSMRKVGRGNFQTAVTVKGRDEISALGHEFNQMVAKLDHLILDLEEEQKNKEEARFQALQAQINPHFLFNTLNSIKLMALLSGTNQNVSDMITALGKLLEFSMKQTQQFVTLRQELEYLELYMTLQKIRFHDNIQLNIHVPEALMDHRVLKFSLQPFVENSIIHGGKLPLTVWIQAELMSDRSGMFITVEDNGNGVPESRLATIQERTIHSNNAKFSGIGVSNVDNRIKLHFGKLYGITLGLSHYGGLKATIRLPIQKEQCE
ncbi:histidine kinase [Paenibacillus chondroitinus]|uniref:Histidine kinase n=1 Tax=Paenibacillus chondroitinus TaxID=59842 RepID=A0ABU6DC48_9BACL|nr:MULTISPECIES: histidine kinase [Paenibacillus]MCY9656812.1 histidine kinase [Paenibacillus anseongense]MEB4794462.1 histidine kinase [Paenibacillus chondroitinus]